MQKTRGTDALGAEDGSSVDLQCPNIMLQCLMRTTGPCLGLAHGSNFHSEYISEILLR